MTLLLDKIFAIVAWGHFIIDVLNGQRGILLTYLSTPLGLSNTALGFINWLYITAGGLLQPLFGWLTDRMGPRWSVAGGVLWMSAFFALATIFPGQIALIFLVTASLGSGAFHPAGAMQATVQGRTRLSGQETTAASYFFLFGMSGYFVGPLAGGVLLDRFGPPGLLALVAVSLPVGLAAAIQLRQVTALAAAPLAGTGQRLRITAPAGVVAALALAAGFQSWIQNNITVFVPKYLSDLGQSASTYGLLASLNVGGYAIGNLLGGGLADRFGKRLVVISGLLLAFLPLALIGWLGYSPWYYLLLPAAGFFTGAAFPSLVVQSQKLIPGGMGLASGLVLGFMFTSGAIGGLLSGFIADRWGFIPVFYMTAVLALAAGVSALGLKRE